MSEARNWFKSSFSGGQGAQCVEVCFAGGEARVRDGKDPDGPVLVFNRGEWDAFELGVFHGEFAFPVA